MDKRLNELDSIRGIASTTVIFHHFLLTLPNIGIFTYFINTPLHIIWAGHEAVILFFVLSGFVLSLPYYNNKNRSYYSFLIKRICRIYLPYLLIFILGLILFKCLSKYGISDLSDWFNRTWTTPLLKKSIMDHVLFLSDFKNNILNPAIWSLIHEMRISIIFPFLMILLVRTKWKFDIAFIILYATFSYCFSFVSYHFLGVVDNNKVSYPDTIHYISMFILGAFLAKYSFIICEWFKAKNNTIKLITFFVAFLSYTYSWWFLPQINFFHNPFIGDWMTAIGSILIIVISLSSQKAKNILSFTPIHFIGKISYSLYLSHCIVLFSMTYIFYGIIPMWLILICSFIFSFLVATILYFAIEIPSIKLGKKLTSLRRIQRKDLIKKQSA